MRVSLNILTTLLLTWPSLALSYCFEACRTGWLAGKIIYEKDSESAIRKFPPK